MSYTCIACRVVFSTADVQRSHYRTDWHRYNLKRKVAELPPVCAELFQQKVLAQRERRVAEICPKQHCKTCNKKFLTDNAYSHHVKSRKHRETELRLFKKESRSEEENHSEVKAQKVDDNLDEEILECDEDEPLEVTDCLFCEHESKNVEENVKHMARSHSFFIPEVEYLVDLKSLIGYLGAKVGMGHVCVWCNRAFASVYAVRHHMVDKGHTLMLYNDSCRDEYSDFYDFRNSYPDHDPQITETEDENSDVDDLRVQVAVCDDEVGELILPSGARVGHRALWQYYRQSLPAAHLHKNRSRTQHVIAQYQTVGWAGSVDVCRLAIEKQRSERAAWQRLESRHHQQLGVKANKLQKHFRSQNFLW